MSSVPNLTGAVTCTSIRKSFGEGEAKVDVLRGVNFMAALGEMTFLVGFFTEFHG